MAIRNPDDTLQQLYAARDELLAGKVASYTLGDRTIQLPDLETVDKLINKYENAVAATTPIYADMRGGDGAFWPQEGN